MTAADVLNKALENDVYLYLEDKKLKFRAAFGALTDELKNEIREHKSEIAELLAKLETQQHADFILPEIVASDVSGAVAVSFAQQSLWFVEQMGPNMAQYNMPGAFHMRGLLNVSAFEQSIATIIERHAVLRTRFEIVDIQPVQVIQKEYALPIQLIDLPEATPQDIQALAAKDARKPFDLSVDLPIRVTLLKLAERHWVVLFNLHHIASDGWSKGILLREFSQLYAAFAKKQPNPLPALRVQYTDYANWQRSLLQGKIQQQLSYWENQLAGIPLVHSLPLDKPRPGKQSHRGASYHQVLSTGLSQAIKVLCKRKDVTLYMLLQCAFSILIHRYSNEADVVIGSAIAGRVHRDLEPLIGFFINTLVVRHDLSENIPFNDFLAQSKQTILNGYINQHVPFEMLVEKLVPERSLRYNPIVQLKLDVQNTEQASLKIEGVELEFIDQERNIARHDLYLSVLENQETITIDWQYATDLFGADTIHRMASNLAFLLQSIVNNPTKPIHELVLVGEEEQTLLLKGFNQSDVVYPKGECVHQLFEKQAALTPDNIAVIYGSQKITYAELNAQSNQLARHLVALGVKPDSLVGLCVERSIEMYIGLFAIMKAGAGYVPLDPNYPSARLEYMLEDSAVDIILCESHLCSNLNIEEQTIVLLDTQIRTALTKLYSPENIQLDDIGLTANNLAYAIYTSGSTGQPKGVLVEHHTVVNFLYYSAETFLPDHVEGSFVSAPLAFDGTVCTLYSSFLKGKYVELLAAGDNDFDVLEKYLFDESRPLLFKVTPAHLEAIKSIRKQQSSSNAQHVFVVAGELLTEKNLSVWRDEYLPNATFFNEYGPTECTVGTTVFRSPTGQKIESVTGSVPIGSPLANAKLYVLDQYHALVPLGAPAELYIGGLQVARGYHGQPELTKNRFIQDPFCKDPNARMYKTGDLVRWLSDGNIEFLGRVDHQVKLRGYRIELGEIENQIGKLDFVAEVVVICRDDEGIDRRLVAYVIPTEPLESENEELLAEQKRQQVSKITDSLKSKLPQYMIPNIIVFMEQFPLTPNGKINRLGMPQPSEGDLQKHVYVAPRNEIEQILCQVWAEVLGLKELGIEDNFFSLGGDSIIAIQVVSRAKNLGLHITVRDMFEYQCIAAISAFVRTDITIDAPQEPISGTQTLLPIQKAFFARKLTNPNHFNQSVLLNAPATLDEGKLKQLITAIYQRHDILRLRFDSESSSEYIPINEAMIVSSLACHDLRFLTKDERKLRTEELCNSAQASLSISSGPTIKAVWFNYGDEPGRLLLVIHHLAVDGVSWRILSKDLSTAWQQIQAGHQVQLFAKSSSVQQWGKALAEYAQTEELNLQRAYWHQQIAAATSSLPTSTYHGPGYQTKFELDATNTSALLGECNNAFRTQVNELLLSALLVAYKQWNGSVNLLMEMEGHGREELFKSLDITDTLGWFTSHYPLVLGCKDDASLEQVIKDTKEQNRKLPVNGVGYGILAAYSDDEVIARHAQMQGKNGIAFNYLGQFDNVSKTLQGFSAAKEFAGEHSDPANAPGARLKIDSQVIDNKLSFLISTAPNQFEPNTIDKLADLYKSSLEACIELTLMLNNLKLEEKAGKSNTKNREKNDAETIYL